MDIIVQIAQALVDNGGCPSVSECVFVLEQLGEHTLRFLAHGFGIEAPPVDWKILDQESREYGK